MHGACHGLSVGLAKTGRCKIGLPDCGELTGPAGVDDCAGDPDVGDVTLQSPQVSLQVDCAATQALPSTFDGVEHALVDGRTGGGNYKRSVFEQCRGVGIYKAASEPSEPFAFS